IRELFFSPLPAGADAPAYHMQREDLAYFFTEKSDIFKQIDQTRQRIIEGHYPGLKISELLKSPRDVGIKSNVYSS
ncbi:MAG: hypothetical protein KAV00_14975, partial [Phycisphaerae bacterium]|nr:hypothetical protein [Phycisphaerae bacterium]